ncbi:MAG: CopG family transcriptional regulator [Acidobacteria bacterium]|nr:CopG family transcriptional regulator [Acidobacteriota bacterium]
MRISARLDEERTQKLEFLTEATHLGKSEILKAAIDVYYQQFAASRPNPAEVLRRTGFIGSGEGPSDLSSRYKELLTEDLAAKHGYR